MEAIQYTDETTERALADLTLETLRDQVDFLGGRILEPAGPGAPWRIQAFFRADGVNPGSWLPDGCRRVTIPDGLRRALGVR